MSLRFVQPQVDLFRYTPDPEKVVATAAKLCYSSLNINELRGLVDKADQAYFIRKIISAGHHSVLEHASYTFLVEGISRVTTHQLVRHRMASYSQRSQRYVREKDEFRYIIPPSLKENPKKLSQLEDLMSEIYTMYNQWVEEGISPEDARYILPNAIETKIVVTMNARELRHFFRNRCCERAQWEIRALALLMLYRVSLVSPVLFEGAGPACISGPCPEGEMSCGHSSRMKEVFSCLSSYSDQELLRQF